MEIDPSNFTRTEGEKRLTIKKACARAIAYEVRANGVKWVSVEATRAGPSRQMPRPINKLQTAEHDLAVCRLAGSAWSVLYHSEETRLKAEETRLQVQTAIDGNLKHVTRHSVKKALDLVGESQQLEQAWKDAKMLVREWRDFVEHAADRLIRNCKELDKQTLEGEEIRRYMNNPSAYGLERP